MSDIENQSDNFVRSQAEGGDEAPADEADWEREKEEQDVANVFCPSACIYTVQEEKENYQRHFKMAKDTSIILCSNFI